MKLLATVGIVSLLLVYLSAGGDQAGAHAALATLLGWVHAAWGFVQRHVSVR